MDRRDADQPTWTPLPVGTPDGTAPLPATTYTLPDDAPPVPGLPAGWRWFRINDDGGTRRTYGSPDGVSWFPLTDH